MKTFLFPTPKYASFPDGACPFKTAALPTDRLVSFCHAACDEKSILFERDASLGKEAYRLHIGGDGIRVTFSDDAGRFYALTTLYQLVRDNDDALPYCDISDEPDFPHRGYMLDISRGRLPKVASIKRLIDELALLKYNELQLYMESFCFKYSAYPEYTADFDCLTPEDIRELERYCAERFIELVPNQNSLGHMWAWLSQPAFSGLRIGSEDDPTDTLNPLLPETGAFLDGLYGSLLPHFSSGRVNVGLDEPFGLGKYQTAEYCKEHGEAALYLKHMHTVQSLVSGKYGKTMMYWADAVNQHRVPTRSLPKDAVALEWGYDIVASEKMMARCIDYHEHGIPFYVCPSCNTHCSLTGRADVMLHNLRSSAEIGKKYGAQGFLLTDWGDAGHPQFPVWSYVPIALGGEYAWNTGYPMTGWDFKSYKAEAACAFADAYHFGGSPVSQYLLRIANYYLLETERVLNGTLTNYNVSRTLDTNAVPVKPYEDAFTNDNVARYVEHNLACIEALPIDPYEKRQIAVNAHTVMLAAAFGNIRVKGGADEEEKARLRGQLEALEREFAELWDVANFPQGKEIFLKKLSVKAEELK